jgi:putative transposase
MTEYQHTAHTRYDIKYHIVWITKYRYKIITPEIGRRLKELLIQGCGCRGMTIVTGHIDKDHVHLLLSCPPSLSPSKIAQYLKGRSSRILQDEYPQLKKRYWGQHLWGRGYFCATTGVISQEMIKEYIESHVESSDNITIGGEFESQP